MTRESADSRAWKVDGRAQALVGPGLATASDGSSRSHISLIIKYSSVL